MRKNWYCFPYLRKEKKFHHIESNFKMIENKRKKIVGQHSLFNNTADGQVRAHAYVIRRNIDRF